VTPHKTRQRDESEAWNRKITYINRCIYTRPFSHDLLEKMLNCSKQNLLSSPANISLFARHFLKMQCRFNFQSAFLLWLKSYALCKKAWLIGFLYPIFSCFICVAKKSIFT
jgi:hypothetical protein